MIHCVCRSINTRLVDEAAAHGARSPACVMKYCGKRFNCGQCIPSIAERLECVVGTSTGSSSDLVRRDEIAGDIPLAAE